MTYQRPHTLRLRRARRGFNLADLCVLLAAAGLMIALVVPTLAVSSREQSNRIKCASNLRMIALGSIMYAGENKGRFSRTYWNPATADPPALYTGADVFNAFEDASSPANPLKANDVTAAFFNALKNTDLTADAFVCPSTEASPFQDDIQSHSNFSGPDHLSYSYNNPFPVASAVQSGWKFDTTVSPEVPLAADMNPGDSNQGGPTKVDHTAPRERMITANSPNHWFDGQQVAYVDGHVEWQTSPFAGAPRRQWPWRDNIYANASGVDSQGKGGVVHGAPLDASDSVLLPTARDAAPGAPAPVIARVPGQSPPADMAAWVMIGAMVLTAVVVGVLVWYLNRKKPQVAYANVYQPGGQQPGAYPPGGYPQGGQPADPYNPGDYPPPGQGQ